MDLLRRSEGYGANVAGSPQYNCLLLSNNPKERISLRVACRGTHHQVRGRVVTEVLVPYFPQVTPNACSINESWHVRRSG